MLMKRSQAEGKGDHGTNHQGCKDNDRVLVFVYFHADSPIILMFVLPNIQHGFGFGKEHVDEQACADVRGDKVHRETPLNDHIRDADGETTEHRHGGCKNADG